MGTGTYSVVFERILVISNALRYPSVLSVHPGTRTGSVQKVCGGVWQGSDHLTKLGSSKVEVVLQ